MKFHVLQNPGRTQRKTPAGEIHFYLKEKNGEVGLRAVNEQGKVAYVATLDPKFGFVLRPDNEFMQGLPVDSDGHIELNFLDDIPEIDEPEVPANPNQAVITQAAEDLGAAASLLSTVAETLSRLIR